MRSSSSLTIRVLGLGLIASIILSCHSSPNKPLGDPLLEFSRQPAEGFCPQDGELFKATVWKAGTGTHTLTGSFLVGYDAIRDSCVATIGRCLVEVPFNQQVLTSTQAAELQALLAAIPAAAPPINFACDPCLITRYEFGGRTADNNPCAEPSDATLAYQQSLAAVESFLRLLAMGSPD